MHSAKWWTPVSDFASRTLVSLAIYVLIAIAAIASFAIVTMAERLGTAPGLVRMFRVLEYLVVAVDVLCFVMYLAKDLRKFFRETFK